MRPNFRFEEEKFDECYHSFPPQEPKTHGTRDPPPPPDFRSGHHPPPRRRPYPRHHPPTPGFESPFRPSPPLTREAFQEMKLFFVLNILNEYKEGITGYQLQQNYKFPRGNLMRTLDDLIEKKYINFDESIEAGRAQKKFLITKEGKLMLEELKEKWTLKFAAMSDMAPPERYGNPMFKRFSEGPMRRLHRIDNKEDAIDLLRGLRSRIKDQLNRLNDRKNFIEENKLDIDDLIGRIEQMDEYDSKKVQEIIQEIRKKYDKNPLDFPPEPPFEDE